MNHWIMDYETLSDCFVAVFKHYKKDETKVFSICKVQDDFHEFMDFLWTNCREKQWHISFNGLAFDAQITTHILKNYIGWEVGGEAFAKDMYQFAQRTIDKANRKEFLDYPEWEMPIGQIDLFKLNHWENPAKRSSLKWIQYTMDWDNILDMPIDHTASIQTKEQLDTVIKYCINDVESTREVFNKSKSLIQLRKTLTDQYDINLFSASEARISKELFAYYLSKELNIPKNQIKKMRTHRDIIKISDVILPYINFDTETFNRLLERFKAVELDPLHTKGGFKYSINYKGVKTHFGLGGVHGAAKAGVYKSDEDNVIMSCDVASFYPNLSIKNKFSPDHIPAEQFCKLYEWFYTERKKIPKSNPMNYVYKIILNSTYGLSNDKNSFLYDPEFTMKITVNGQLSLMMLYEMLMENIPNSKPLLQNTDGIELIIPREYMGLYHQICSEWELITNLELEHDEYEKIILADVNNYIAMHSFKEVDITTWNELRKKHSNYVFKVEDNKFYYAPTKCKGRFEFTGLALHKNKSKLVVPKAIFEYFINDKLPEDYIKENRNILDYCIGSKTNSGWQQLLRTVNASGLHEEKLQKINRYYVSNSGGKIIKKNKDGREIQLESGQWLQTTFNDIKLNPKWESYNINEKYYLQAIEKEINNILGNKINQLMLFE